MIPIYSSVAGGVSSPRVWKEVPSVDAAFWRIMFVAFAKQLDSLRFTTAVCEVVVSDDATSVVIPATESGKQHHQRNQHSGELRL